MPSRRSSSSSSPAADLNAVRDKLRAHFPADQFPYRIQTWRDMQGPLLAAVQMETTLLNILLFLIIAVAGFGILATFFMIVVEKTRDIGILKALGAPSRGVMSIFLSYGFSLGLVGSGAGMIGGLLFVAYINEIAKLIEIVTGPGSLRSDRLLLPADSDRRRADRRRRRRVRGRADRRAGQRAARPPRRPAASGGGTAI